MTSEIKSKMARGAAWMILFKWVERGLGLVSTLILVRLLTPEDFGMVAMAMSFILMAEVLSAFAFDIALIHDQKAGRDHYNSAWTAEILLGCIIALIMWGAAKPISEFYDQPDLFLLICVLALGPVLTGFENIGIVAFRKELEFHKEFFYQVARKVIGFSITIPLAFYLQSYWALVFGMLASKAGATLLSYWAHPFRPWFSLKEIRALLSFSSWLLLNNMVNFLKERLSDFFIGRMHGPATLGVYNIGNEFANLPTFEIGAPINRALLPGFAKLKDDLEGIESSFKSAVGLVALMAIPVGIGIFSIAPYMVPVVLGEKWLAATPVMEILSLYSCLLVFHGTIVTLFIAIGHPREATKINIIFVMILLAGLFLLVSDYGAVGAAYSALAACIIATPLYLLKLRQMTGVKLTHFFVATIRPSLAAFCMALTVRSVMPDYQPGMAVGDAGLILFACIVLGGVVFSVSQVLLWLLAGKPEGPESLVWSKIAIRMNAFREKFG